MRPLGTELLLDLRPTGTMGTSSDAAAKEWTAADAFVKVAGSCKRCSKPTSFSKMGTFQIESCIPSVKASINLQEGVGKHVCCTNALATEFAIL